MQNKVESDELEISIPDLLSAIWELRLIIIALMIVGGVVGLLLSGSDTPVYETRASMLVNARTSAGTYSDGSDFPKRDDVLLATDLAKTVQLLTTSDRVLEQVLEQVESEEITLEQLRESVTVTEEENTSFLWLTLQWEDSQTAIELLNVLMDTLPDVMLEVMDIGSVSVIDQAREIMTVSRSTSTYGVFGTAAGAVIGLIIGICYYLFIPKIRRNDILENLGLDVIATIPNVPANRKISEMYMDAENLPRNYQESFGRLTAVFRYQAEQEDSQIIAVTSTLDGEGKSTITYNLALCLTNLGCKVLLLDFDFQKSILYQLARSRKKKDGDVRTIPRDGKHLRELIEQMYNGVYTIQGFSQKDVLRIGNDIFPTLREMKNQFDYILIDTPPVGIMSDIQQMRGLMDGVLFVVRQNQVTSRQVEQSVGFLEKTGIRVLGCVVNGSEHREDR